MAENRHYNVRWLVDRFGSLTRLNIDPRHWVYLTKDFESPFKSLVGSAYRIKRACEQMGKNWVHGMKRCAEVFPDT